MHTSYISIVKRKQVYTVFAWCKETHLHHKSLLHMSITYLLYVCTGVVQNV